MGLPHEHLNPDHTFASTAQISSRSIFSLIIYIASNKMVDNKVDLNAYAIPLLHAAKYPASAVCGVLLGKNTSDGSVIKSAVPFFHHWTTVTPMLEVALKQVRKYKTNI
jgi:hypothetical protein